MIIKCKYIIYVLLVIEFNIKLKKVVIVFNKY